MRFIFLLPYNQGWAKKTRRWRATTARLRCSPNFAEALFNRGWTLHELKRLEEALASYDRALTVRPDLAEALYNRGLTLHELKRFEEALSELRPRAHGAAGLCRGALQSWHYPA